MAAKKSAASSFIAAAVLAGLTLFVFFTFQNYGPESAVRRFNDDLRNHDFTDLQRVTLQQLDSRPVLLLAQQLVWFDSHDAHSRIAATQMTQSDQASVIMVFQLPDQESRFKVWIVRKEPNQPWRVDADLTVQEPLFGPRSNPPN